MVNKGNGILSGEINEVRNKYKKNLFEIESDTKFDDLDRVPGKIIEKEDKKLVIYLEDDSKSNALLNYFLSRGQRITSFKEILPSLNEIFIQTVESN